MGWFDGRSEVSSHSHSGSHRHHSSGSVFGGHHNSSRSSFFGGGRSSYYKRSPRSGYINRMLHKLRRLLRDLVHYMKKHPMKVFVLVIMPLITGGALTSLLRQFGIRLPHGIEKWFGGAAGSSSIARGRNGDLQWERRSYDGPMEGLGSLGGSAAGLMNLAKLFV